MRPLISCLVFSLLGTPVLSQEISTTLFDQQVHEAERFCLSSTNQGQTAFNDCVSGRTLTVSLADKDDGTKTLTAIGASRSMEKSTSYVISIACTAGDLRTFVFKSEDLVPQEKIEDKAHIRYRFGDGRTVQQTWNMLSGKAVGSGNNNAKLFMEEARRANNGELTFEIMTTYSLNTIEFKQNNFKEVAETFLQYCQSEG